MNFAITTTHDGPKTVWHPAGELDIATVPVLERALFASFEDGGVVVLDLSQVSFCDSTGVHLLVRASRHAQGHGVGFTIVSPSAEVSRLLGLCGLLDVLPIGMQLPSGL